MNWLEPLINAGPFLRAAQRASKPDERMGLAILLDVRLSFYTSIAGRSGWPRLGETVPERADSSRRLLSAVGLHISGDERAEAEYVRLTRVRDTSLCTLASALLSVYYSDTDRGRDAVPLLRRQLRKSVTPVERVYIHLQLGLRHAELSEYQAAILETQLALGASTEVRETQWRRLFTTIATHNLYAFELKQSRFTDPLRLPLRSESALLLRTDVLQAAGLSEYLMESFKNSLADPFSRTVVFGAEDETENRLRGALLRSELLADWSEVRNNRMLLGRYLVISRLGTPGSVPAAALELLRLGGDTEGLRAAARTLARMGPLGSLQLATNVLVERPLAWAREAACSFELLAEGADLLDEETASIAVSELVERRHLLTSSWDHSARALAALVKVSSNATQTDVAMHLRSVLGEELHAGLIQALARVVAAIRWDEVDPSERREWLSLVNDEFGSGRDTHFVAVQALLALGQVEQEAVDRILSARYRNQPSLELVAITIDSLHTLPIWVRPPARLVVSSALSDIRQNAAAGTYQFSSIDAGNVAVVVLARGRRNERGWNDLVEFLFDPKVGVDEKTGALVALARRDVRIPKEVRQRLAAELPNLTAASNPLGGSAEELRAATLRLGARIGAFSRDQLLARLLELARSANTLSRIQAANTITSARTRLGVEIATTLALSIANDAHHDVRASAAAALAGLRVTDVDSPLEVVRRERLAALLGEPGRIVPLGAVVGLRQTVRDGNPIDEGLARAVRSLVLRHPSRTLRSAAQALLTELNESES